MKVIIGGYSQGATIALRTLLTACQRGLGGLVVLKGWVARSGSISDVSLDLHS
jgi:predicted esterase